MTECSTLCHPEEPCFITENGKCKVKGKKMNKIKHTPGPWIVSDVDTICPRIDSANGRGVAHATQRDPHPINGQGITIEEAFANARLIAAAPELLAALIEARSLLEESEQCYENQMFRNAQIDAAIRKAKRE